MKTLIIAEAGVNHNGNMDQAKALIDIGKRAGVDYIKFQTFKADTIVSRNAKLATYQKSNIGVEETQYSMLKKLELSDSDHRELIAYCKLNGVKFFSTAFDIEGLLYLNSLGMDRFKVPSGEITNWPYLNTLAELAKPVILSTGMANIHEIRDAMDTLTSKQLNKSDITILHCNTEYPTPMEDVNLRAMIQIQKEFGVAVGYSDHTLGIEVPIAAVALGATVIEKHFTIDRNLSGPDHKASLEPQELIAMVKGIRNIELAMGGSGIKETSPSEMGNRVIARKSIFVKTKLKKGHILTETDLIPLRPGDGITPMNWKKVIGNSLNKDLEAFDQLSWEDLT
ncbi:MAG: N-acetylneuraminate synthase [Candidatus Levybacteria bacterium]|nr:N-acetylneuraminate synthase [Candidatus Levybacteria bacterium]